MGKITSRDNQSRVAVALFDDLARAGVNLDIYERDEMFLVFYWAQSANRDAAVSMYLASGRSIWRTLAAVLQWRCGSLAKVGRLLDFAGGFGRVTRFMVGEIPPARIWVADLQAEALAVQAVELGVHTLQSTEDPAQLELPGEFDAIVVSSLFSHLPEPLFVAWLAKLGRAVAPGGVLILSVHGADLLAQPPSTIEFRPASESQRLPRQSYGSSWVSEAFVRDTVRTVLGASWQVLRFERGVLAMQDLYVLTPDHRSDPEALRLPRELDGLVERFEIDAANVLYASGWLADRQLRRPCASVRLRLGGLTIGALEAAELSARPDAQAVLADAAAPVWGYALQAQLAAGWDPSAALELVCRFENGEEVPVLQGTLAAALLRGARVAAMYTEYRAQAAEAALREAAQAAVETAGLSAQLKEDLAAADRRAADLAGRIRWMEASRFWRLRNRWFALKRWLRF